MSREVLLLGNAVSQSLSPAMMNAAFAALNIDACYQPREIDGGQLAQTISEMRRSLDILGANVTIPLKESVLAHLDELDPLAERVGAVNTISRSGQLLVGWNTDVPGFQKALDECGYDIKGKAVAIIGAGGAARAVAEAIRDRASTLFVIARNRARAAQLIDDLGLDQARAVAWAKRAPSISRAAVVVNATPADLPAEGILRADQRLFDLRSRRSREGRSMLLHQGADAFEIWTGKVAPLEIMRAALDHAARRVAA